MIDFIHLPKAICHHAIGKDHTLAHRMWAGFGIMIFGVSTAKAAALMPDPIAHHFIVHYGLDLMGYAIHGLGAIPFIEYFLED